MPPREKMSSSTAERTAAVLTVSDSCSRGEKTDLSGPAVAKALERRKFRVTVQSIVSDETIAILQKLIELGGSARLVVTTGGRRVGPPGRTPRSPRRVKQADGGR